MAPMQCHFNSRGKVLGLKYEHLSFTIGHYVLIRFADSVQISLVSSVLDLDFII